MDDLQTSWDSSFATLQRIDNLLKIAADCSAINDYQGWFKTLQNVRKEAIVKMPHRKTKKSDTGCRDDCLRCQCEGLFLPLSNLMKAYPIYQDNMDFEANLNSKLDEFEVFLRDVMNAKGMLMKDNYDRGL
jgi:hypothetical protein